LMKERGVKWTGCSIAWSKRHSKPPGQT